MRYVIEGNPYAYETGWSEHDLTADEMLEMLPGSGVSTNRHLREGAITKLKLVDAEFSAPTEESEA